MAERLRKNKKIWLVIAAMEILLVCLAGFLYSRREPVELSFTQDDPVYDSGEPGFYIDTTGSRITTPEFTLPRGMYTVTIQYEYEGPAIMNVSYTDGRMVPELSGDIQTRSSGTSTCDFKVRYGNRPMQVNGRLRGDAWEGCYLLVQEITITNSPLALRNYVFCLLLYLLFFDIVAIAVLFRNYLGSLSLWQGEYGQISRGLILLVLASSIPLMVGYLIGGHDFTFHLMRIEGIKAGLQSGAFPVKIQPNWLNGHGYAVSVFYGDLLLYVPAILRIFGISIQSAYNFYVLMINTATVFVAYYCFARISTPKAGLIAAALYSLNIYRLTCIYTRSAVGEYSAMVFLPLILYGLWKVYMLPEDSREHRNSWGAITAGYMGLIVTHMISCEMAAFFTVLGCLLLWRKTFRFKNFKVLFTAVIAILLLNIWFLVPFLDYMISGVYNLNSPDAYAAYRLDDRTTYPAQLFMNEYAETEEAHSFSSGAVEEMPQTIGVAFFLIVAIWFVIRFGKKNEESKAEKWEEGVCLAFGILSLFLTTYLMPYTSLARMFPFLEFPERSLQYPWRFLSMAGVFFCWFAAIFFKKNWLKGEKKQWIAGALLLVSFWQGLSYMSGVLNENSATFIYQEGNMTTMEISNGEYLPVGSKVEDYVPVLTYNMEALQVSAWNRVEDGINITLSNLTQQEQEIEIPLLYYKGYHALSNGEELHIEPGTSSRITILIPAEFEGEIFVGFFEPWYWRVCEVISMFALLGILVWIYVDRKKSGWKKLQGQKEFIR